MNCVPRGIFCQVSLSNISATHWQKTTCRLPETIGSQAIRIFQSAICIFQFAIRHPSPPSTASINVRIAGKPNWAVALPKHGGTMRHPSKRLRLRDNSEGNGVHQARRVAKRNAVACMHGFRTPNSVLRTPYSRSFPTPHSAPINPITPIPPIKPPISAIRRVQLPARPAVFARHWEAPCPLAAIGRRSNVRIMHERVLSGKPAVAPNSLITHLSQCHPPGSLCLCPACR